jgi:hypothetical protein
VSVSGHQQYVRPIMRAQGSGALTLINSRHPCVEAQDSINFIANDVIMSADKRYPILTVREEGTWTLTQKIPHNYGTKHGRKVYIHTTDRSDRVNVTDWMLRPL